MGISPVAPPPDFNETRKTRVVILRLQRTCYFLLLSIAAPPIKLIQAQNTQALQAETQQCNWKAQRLCCRLKIESLIIEE